MFTIATVMLKKGTLYNEKKNKNIFNKTVNLSFYCIK